MKYQKISKHKNEIEIWSKDPVIFHGSITRTPLSHSEFGNYGAIKYSILGKKYWAVGGKDITLPISVINKLKSKGELK